MIDYLCKPTFANAVAGNYGDMRRHTEYFIRNTYLLRFMKQSIILENISARLGISQLNPMQQEMMATQAHDIVLLSISGGGAFHPVSFLFWVTMENNDKDRRFLPDIRVLSRFDDWYSRTKLFDKISRVAKKAGVKGVYAALLLYYALADGKVPLRDKVIVVGALGYFICPTDFIPDILGPLGYTDDISALMWALSRIWHNITPAVHEKSRARLRQWFPGVEESDLTLF